jgi:hypothetical protein
VLVKRSTPKSQPVESHVVLRSTTFAGMLHTEPTSSSQIVRTRSGAVALLRTSDASFDDVRRLTDEELLSFFRGKSVALVRGPGGADLVVAGN